MTAAASWWPATWSLVRVRLHETNVPQSSSFAGFTAGGFLPTLPSHPTPTPALTFAGSGLAPDSKETTVPRRGGYVERHARRLEDKIAEIGTHLARAERRRRLFAALEADAKRDVLDFQSMLADLREARAERHPSGLAVAS